MRCDICKSEKTHIKNYHHKIKIKGKEIEYDSDRRFCTNCNNLVYDENLDNQSSLIAIKKYNQIYGIPAEVIIKFRKEYSISQSLFAKILGCAKKTLIDYEHERYIPNDVYCALIKTLINQPGIMKSIVESNKEKFDKNEYKIISTKIYPIIGKNTERLIGTLDIDLNENNGYTAISYEKIKQVVAYFCKKGLNKTKLLKELFYSDFLCYKENGYSITGLEYAKCQFGPVPDNHEILLNNLNKDKILKLKAEIKGNYEENNYFTINKNFDIKELNKDELKILERINKFFDDFTARDIADFSHEEKGWQETDNYSIISYEYAFDLQVIK